MLPPTRHISKNKISLKWPLERHGG